VPSPGGSRQTIAPRSALWFAGTAAEIHFTDVGKCLTSFEFERPQQFFTLFGGKPPLGRARRKNPQIVDFLEEPETLRRQQIRNASDSDLRAPPSGALFFVPIESDFFGEWQLRSVHEYRYECNPWPIGAGAPFRENDPVVGAIRPEAIRAKDADDCCGLHLGICRAGLLEFDRSYRPVPVAPAQQQPS